MGPLGQFLCYDFRASLELVLVLFPARQPVATAISSCLLAPVPYWNCSCALDVTLTLLGEDAQILGAVDRRAVLFALLATPSYEMLLLFVLVTPVHY